MRQHKDSSIGDALKKKQWLFGVGGFLLLGLIVGCDKDEQPKQEVQAEPAAAAPADSAAEFSENTKLLLALYQELHLFKDDPEFHEVGFGACCRFHDWQTRVEELRSRTELETLMDIDVVPGDLLVLGLEYMKSKGSPTGYTQTMDPKFRSGVSVTAGRQEAERTRRVGESYAEEALGREQEAAAQIEALEREQEAAAQIVGRWLNEGPLRYRMTIFHEGGKLYTEQKFTDGGSLKKEMVEKRSPLGRRFDPVEASRAGDHWIIDSRGNLQSRDNEGLITTARKIE